MTEVIQSKEIYPISDFEHKVETGYFNDRGRYIGGIPILKKVMRHAICEEHSIGNGTNVCTNWIIIEKGENHSNCRCSDMKCMKWICMEYYTGIINNRCECSDDCLSWKCEGSQEETIEMGYGTITKDIIISHESFDILGNNTCNGVIYSSTRYSQEFCMFNVSEGVLWECTRKTYRNCRTKYNVWCRFYISLVLIFLPFTISCIAFLRSFFLQVIFYIFFFFIISCLTLFGIIVSGGIYGIYISILVLMFIIICWHVKMLSEDGDDGHASDV